MKHQICRTVLAAAAVTAGVFLSACGLFRDTADSVFDDAEDAIATDRTSLNIKTAQFEYEFDDGTATIRYQAPDNVRIDVLDGADSAVFCLSGGSSGWMFLRGEVFDMTADDIMEMHGALLQTIPFKMNYQDIFKDAELEEASDDACGEECDVIHAVFRRAPEVKAKLWIGKKSDLLRQFEVAREEGVYTMMYFDYRDFDGVTLPSEMFRFTPDGASKLSLLSFETNIEIPDYVFQKPEKFSTVEGDK